MSTGSQALSHEGVPLSTDNTFSVLSFFLFFAKLESFCLTALNFVVAYNDYEIKVRASPDKFWCQLGDGELKSLFGNSKLLSML